MLVFSNRLFLINFSCHFLHIQQNAAPFCLRGGVFTSQKNSKIYSNRQIGNESGVQERSTATVPPPPLLYPIRKPNSSGAMPLAAAMHNTAASTVLAKYQAFLGGSGSGF